MRIAVSHCVLLGVCRIPRTTVDVLSHTPGAVFQARLLDNHEGATTERYVLGKLSATCFSNAELLGTDTINSIPAVDILSIEHRARAV